MLLLLDNAPSHSSEEQLNAVHDNFKVIYLPPNVTAALQPMDQGVIEQTKRNYKKRLLRCVLDTDISQIAFLKQFTLLHCVNMIAEAWNDVSHNNLLRAWKYLLSIDNVMHGTRDARDDCSHDVPYDSCTQNEMDEWINSDGQDQGWEPQHINGIIDTLTNNNAWYVTARAISHRIEVIVRIIFIYVYIALNNYCTAI